jgi:pantoate--beta-alanine ligase
MRLAIDRHELDSVARLWRQEGLTLALVPTMGNLHEGHLALVRAARKAADRVVCSIYVNPTQFGEGEDFERYPRTPESDGMALEAAGCDLLFSPGHDTMYPNGLENAVRLAASPDLATVLEGAERPGHFDGVVTVVARLFNLVRPDVAVFGEKDYQQLLVIRRMTRDLGYAIKILAVPTVREESGLAMSSRNNYLDRVQRTAAGRLNAVLNGCAKGLQNSGASAAEIERRAVAELERAGFSVDYVAVRRADDLGRPDTQPAPLRVLAAVRSGATRLIDNVPVS